MNIHYLFPLIIITIGLELPNPSTGIFSAQLNGTPWYDVINLEKNHLLKKDSDLFYNKFNFKSLFI